MKFKTLLFFALVTILTPLKSYSITLSSLEAGNFNIEKDLLLVNYDCKTDVDDLHSVAAFITLMSAPAFKKVNYHAVAGTYGIQEGLYVPPNDLFRLAFGDNWTDAHENL